MKPDYYFDGLRYYCLASIEILKKDLEEDTYATERGKKYAKELISQLKKAIAIVDDKTTSDQEKYLRLQAFNKIIQKENNN